MMNLSKYIGNRDNNFNLIRLLSSIAVLVSHGFALIAGTGNAEPLRMEYGMTPGTLAVDVFFVTSGYLVTTSLFRKKNLIEYFVSRLLRIIPGLFVMLLIVVFGIGLCVTSFGWRDYISSNATYVYIAKSLTMVSGVGQYLPGVFNENPYKGAVNGSLWTLTYEVFMYFLLALTWFLGLIFGLNEKFLKKIIVMYAAAALIYSILSFELGEKSKVANLIYMFFAGGSYYVLSRRIELSIRLLVISLSCLLASFAINNLYYEACLLFLPYIVICVAYIPDIKLIKKYNIFGDYSYGIYIYSFPLQQLILWMNPGVSLIEFLFYSVNAAVVVSIFSWELVEKRAMSKKDILIKKINCRYD